MDRIATAEAVKQGDAALALIAQIENAKAQLVEASRNLEALRSQWQTEGAAAADMTAIDVALALAVVKE